jgi:hypothetical protein
MSLIKCFMSYVDYSICLIESDRYVWGQTSAQIQTQPQETMGKTRCVLQLTGRVTGFKLMIWIISIPL